MDLGIVESGKGDGGPPPDGRFVVEGVEDGGQSPRVTDGAEGRYRRFAAQRIPMTVVPVGHRGQPGDSTARALFPQCPGRHLHHTVVTISEGIDQSHRRTPGRHLAGPPSHCRIGIGQSISNLGVDQHTQTLQGAEGGGAHSRVRVGQSGPGDGGVAGVASQGNQAPPLGDRGIGDRRGRLHHTTMTDTEPETEQPSRSGPTRRTDQG